MKQSSYSPADNEWIDARGGGGETQWAVAMGGRVVEEMRISMYIWTDGMRENLALCLSVCPGSLVSLNTPLWRSRKASLLAVGLHFSSAVAAASSSSQWHIWYLQRDANPISNVNYDLLMQTNESELNHYKKVCLILSGRTRQREQQWGVGKKKSYFIPKQDK